MTELVKFLTEPYSYSILRILREGPLKREGIDKFLSASKNLKNPKTVSKKIKKLEAKKFIASFNTKVGDQYYLLIRDFYVIRIPPKQTIDFIQKDLTIPESYKKRYLVSMKRFFSEYVNSNKILNDDIEANLIAIFFNTELMEFIKYLKKKPLDTVTLSKKFENSEKIIDILSKLNIIEIYTEKKNLLPNWIFLKSDLEFRLFFPEYLIKNISEDLRNKKINKEIALRALYSLKNNYLLSEKPDIYEDLNSRINNKLEIIKNLEKKGNHPVVKVKELIKLFKQIGDYDNRLIWRTKILEWQKANGN